MTKLHLLFGTYFFTLVQLSFGEQTTTSLLFKEQLAHITLRTASLTNSQTGFCSGILVAKNLVLTNAHCFDPLNKDTVYAERVTFPFSKKKDYSIHSFASHPDYLENTNIYKDIAWIKLKNPVDLNDLKPATLNTHIIKDQTNIRFFGYSQQSLNIYNDHLTDPTEALLELFSERFESLFLAFSSGKELARPGDSGGPVYIKHRHGWKLFGLILENSCSFTPHLSTTFIKLNYFREWIETSSQTVFFN